MLTFVFLAITVVLILLGFIWLASILTDTDPDTVISKRSIISSDMTAGQELVVKLTLLTGYMVSGTWKEDRFEADICGECSSEKIAKIRALVACAKNNCHIIITHKTANGPEIIYGA